jgi:hypothetical protein
MPYPTTIKQSHIDLRGVYLPAAFIAAHDLQPKQEYPLRVEGLDANDLSGTLTSANFIGGLARMYRVFDIELDDTIQLDFVDGTIVLAPPLEPPAPAGPIVPVAVPEQQPDDTVFGRKKLKHLLIEPFRHASIKTWTPRTETDVYLVFGTLSEYQLTDYRYCCGASKDLLAQLGYDGECKPDAIVIDRATSQYLMAEFKMYSSDFKGNHKKEDVDLLICWIDDEKERDLLPPHVLALNPLIETGLRQGDIEL